MSVIQKDTRYCLKVSFHCLIPTVIGEVPDTRVPRGSWDRRGFFLSQPNSTSQIHWLEYVRLESELIVAIGYPPCLAAYGNERQGSTSELFCIIINVSSSQLASGQTPGELLTPLVLNSILHKALQYSLHGDTHLASNFTFALRFLPETFHPHAPDSLNCLELRYKVRQLNGLRVRARRQLKCEKVALHTQQRVENQHPCKWLELTHWLKGGWHLQWIRRSPCSPRLSLSELCFLFPVFIHHHLSSHHNVLTSFINLSILAHLSSLPHTCPPPSPTPTSTAFFHTHIFLHPPLPSSQVDWPLNIIITDSCTNKYNRLFSFLLQLKHMVWSLREVWFHLKRTGEGVGAVDRGPAWPTTYL